MQADTRERLLDAAVVVAWAPLAWRHAAVVEDAFISFRFARSWAQGLGLRFNPTDPPIEGFSNLLLVMAAAACEAVGVPPERAIPLLTAGCAVVVLLGTLALARRGLGISRAASRAGVLALAVLPSFTTWSTSGLEPMPQALLFLGAAAGLAFAERPREQWLAGVAGLLLALLRTEGALWSPVLLGLALLLRRAEGRPLRPAAARYTAVVVPGVAALLAFKAWTFGAVVSNVASTKLAPLHLAVPRGLAYVASFLLLTAWAAPVVLLAAREARRPRVAWALALALAVPGWAVLVGGDYLAWHRFLVPGLPFLALLLAVVLDRATAALGASGARTVAAVVTVVGLLPEVGPQPLAALRALDTTSPNRAEARAHEAVFRDGRLVVRGAQRKLELEAEALGAFTEPGDVVVTGAVGLAGYRNPDLVLLDLCGLVTPAARASTRRARERPGHDACTGPAAFLDRDPDVLVFAGAWGPDAASTIRADVEAWRRKHPVRRYAPDLVTVRSPRVPGEVFVGYGLRRVPDGEDAAARWAAFDGKVSALAAELADAR